MFLCVSTQLESFLSHKKLEKSFKLLVFVLEYAQAVGYAVAATMLYGLSNLFAVGDKAL